MFVYYAVAVVAVLIIYYFIFAEDRSKEPPGKG